MKIGVFNPVLAHLSFDAACEFLRENHVDMIEIGCGGYPGRAHCDPKELLGDETKLKAFQKTIEKHGLTISGLSCHGNPVHPNPKIAKQFDDDLTNAILLCERLGVSILNTFSGCPGDGSGAAQPNWVTCPWPPEYSEVLDYQWNKALIPYWREKAAFARAHGVTKIALELHPGFCVYNTDTLLRLRDAVGQEIGANLDPSHLIWQGMDPLLCIRELGARDAIFHFHAKDTKIDRYNTAKNGVLDTTPYTDEARRSWIFRSVGYGMGKDFWRDVVSELRIAGYDYVLSIEHEDSLMSEREGLLKSIECLREVIINEPRGDAYWA